MNFEITETSVFKLQFNEPEQFLINSKKYRIDADEDEAVTQGIIEFQDDHFNRVVTFILDPTTLSPSPKSTFVRVLQNGNQIYSYELQLYDYVQQGVQQGPVKVELSKGKEIPEEAHILGLTFMLELVEVLDDDNQSHQVLRKQMQKKQEEQKEREQAEQEQQKMQDQEPESNDGEPTIQAFSNESQKLREEIAALNDQSRIQNLLKLKLQQDYEEARAESESKDAAITRLKDQIRSLLAAKENEESEQTELQRIYQ